MAVQSFGIIGYGVFGELLSQLLAPYADKIVVNSRREIPAYQLLPNVQIGTLVEVAACDVIILCNELSALEENCISLVKLVQPHTVVMDVCSVKLLPAQILHETLSQHCKVLATHPLFGPQSVPVGKDHGKKMVWHEISGGPFPELEDIFHDKLGLSIIRMSPEDHDKQMAWIHCLTFFVGRGLVELNPPYCELATNYYERLQAVVNIEKQHSYELFRTVQLGNIYSGQIRKEFIQRLQEIDTQLQEDHI
ncbi:MAG TPA: prephenate dehydrogenase/arogenate dehydrogenase family protein [Candidatus Limnocylindrales bacterium]|nr:prephenate dehydrogenase/arogenate dehydrogenase family protein [Candidatus Limnocylindrales bacterium]